MSEISNNAFVLNSHKASDFLLKKGNTSSDAIRRIEERKFKGGKVSVRETEDISSDEIEFIKEYFGNKSIDQLNKEMKEVLKQMKIYIPENPPISRDDEWRDEDCWDNDYVEAARLNK